MRTFFVICLAVIASWATQPISLAILDLEGSSSIEPDQLLAITDRLQSEIISSKKFQVVDRSQSELILSEQGFQNSGVCTANECQVQMGQMLGVDYLLTGKVVAFGELWAISLRYLDVRTGAVEKVFSYEVRGELVDVLRDGCQRGAEMLARYVDPSSISSNVPQASPKASKPQWKKPVVIGLGVVGLSALIGGVWLHNRIQSDYDDYQQMTDADLGAYDKQWNSIQDNQKIRNGLWGAGALLLASGASIQLLF